MIITSPYECQEVEARGEKRPRLAYPWRRGALAFDQRHFLLGQAVEVIDQAVNLAVGGLQAALEEIAVGGSSGLRQALM